MKEKKESYWVELVIGGENVKKIKRRTLFNRPLH